MIPVDCEECRARHAPNRLGCVAIQLEQLRALVLATVSHCPCGAPATPYELPHAAALRAVLR